LKEKRRWKASPFISLLEKVRARRGRKSAADGVGVRQDPGRGWERSDARGGVKKSPRAVENRRTWRNLVWPRKVNREIEAERPLKPGEEKKYGAGGRAGKETLVRRGSGSCRWGA